MKILIIEDDIQCLELLTRMLQNWGYEPHLADSGKSALEKIREEDFDLILMDIYLSDSEALKLIPVLKLRNPKTKIITITGHKTEELQQELHNLGITNCMSKPFTQKELKLNIDHLVSRMDPPPI